jgi:hypothetical protein
MYDVRVPLYLSLLSRRCTDEEVQTFAEDHRGLHTSVQCRSRILFTLSLLQYCFDRGARTKWTFAVRQDLESLTITIVRTG